MTHSQGNHLPKEINMSYFTCFLSPSIPIIPTGPTSRHSSIVVVVVVVGIVLSGLKGLLRYCCTISSICVSSICRRSLIWLALLMFHVLY